MTNKVYRPTFSAEEIQELDWAVKYICLEANKIIDLPSERLKVLTSASNKLHLQVVKMSVGLDAPAYTKSGIKPASIASLLGAEADEYAALPQQQATGIVKKHNLSAIEQLALDKENAEALGMSLEDYQTWMAEVKSRGNG